MQAQEIMVKKDTITLKEGIKCCIQNLIENRNELSESSEKFLSENSDEIFHLLFNDIGYFKSFDFWCIEIIAKAMPQYEKRIINIYKIYTTSGINLLDLVIKESNVLLMNEFNSFMIEKSHGVNTEEDRQLTIEFRQIVDKKIASIPESHEIYSAFKKLKNYLDGINIIPTLKNITTRSLIANGIFKPEPKEYIDDIPHGINIDVSGKSMDKKTLNQIVYASMRNEIAGIF